MELCTRVSAPSAERSSAAVGAVRRLGARLVPSQVAQMQKQKEAPRMKPFVAAEAASRAVPAAQPPVMLPPEEAPRPDAPEQPELPSQLQLGLKVCSRASSPQAQPSWDGLLQPAALPQASPVHVLLTGPLLVALPEGPRPLFSA